MLLKAQLRNVQRPLGVRRLAAALTLIVLFALAGPVAAQAQTPTSDGWKGYISVSGSYDYSNEQQTRIGSIDTQFTLDGRGTVNDLAADRIRWEQPATWNAGFQENASSGCSSLFPPINGTTRISTSGSGQGSGSVIIDLFTDSYGLGGGAAGASSNFPVQVQVRSDCPGQDNDFSDVREPCRVDIGGLASNPGGLATTVLQGSSGQNACQSDVENTRIDWYLTRGADPPECADGLDNDQDGFTDYAGGVPGLRDPGCQSNEDDSEADATIELRKQLLPVDDPGRFDLLIDGEIRKEAAGNGDTTRPKLVEPGTHTVAEESAVGLDGQATNLAHYGSHISCTDQQGDMVAEGTGPGPLDLDAAAGQQITCVASNERQGVACNDGVDNNDPEDSLADFPADPDCLNQFDVDEDNPVLKYAPAVVFHPEERFWPADPGSFAGNSTLSWANIRSPLVNPCLRRDVVFPAYDGSFTSQQGLAAGSYSYDFCWRQRAEIGGRLGPEQRKLFGTNDFTAPRGLFASTASDQPAGDSGFFLDLDNSLRRGIRPLRRATSYTNGPVLYYEYKPRGYIVYWFFYARNNREGDTHEGDWEHITVDLDPDDQASAVAYYQHNCDPQAAGTDYGIFTWQQMLANEYVVQNTHPVVFSAIGAHASYPEDVGSELLPCRNVLNGFRDNTAPGLPWRTWERGLAGLASAGAQAWYGFGGGWGEKGGGFWGPLGPGPIKLQRDLVVPTGW